MRSQTNQESTSRDQRSLPRFATGDGGSSALAPDAPASVPYTLQHVSERARRESRMAKRLRGYRLYLFGPSVFVVLFLVTGSVAFAGVVAIVAMGISHGHLERTAPYLDGLRQPLPTYAKGLALANFQGATLTLSGAFIGFALVVMLGDAAGWTGLLPGVLGVETRDVGPETVLLLALPVLLLADVSIYAYHRCCHESGIHALWRMHRVHHSIPQFTLEMGPRANPVETVITYGLCGVAGGLLGVGLAPTIAAAVFMACIMSPHHINCDSELGLFGRLFVTTEAHRWHHNIDHRDSGNFGLLFSFWDRCLGTHHTPARFSGRLGVGDEAGEARSSSETLPSSTRDSSL